MSLTFAAFVFAFIVLLFARVALKVCLALANQAVRRVTNVLRSVRGPAKPASSLAQLPARMKSSSSQSSASSNAAVEPKPMAERTFVGIDYSVFDEPTWKRRDIQLSF